jgi:outer membrane protein TolC
MMEVMATGLEPLNEVSAPLVSGRDFVGERWRIEMTVPLSALQLEKSRLAEARRRYEVGAAGAADLDVARSRIVELETVVEALGTKMVIRQQFLKKEIDAALAVLRVLEAEAQQRRAALLPRVDLARKQLKDIKTRVDIGTAAPLELAEAQVRLKELELDLMKADMDLTIARQKIQQHRVGG